MTPLKTETLLFIMCMKSIVGIICVLWLIIIANATELQQQQQHQLRQQQPQIYNYKQQLQYQMQQHDKFEYQQHLKQQQHYYQQQYHQHPQQQQQQPQLQPTSMALLQEQQQQHQQHHQQQYFPAKPTQQQQQHQLRQQQPQIYNYKQQLQYQMQQHDKFEYQQHLKQQQHYYQQQYHQHPQQQQQQPQLQPTSMALLQEQQQQHQQHHQQQYFPAKPTQMLQTAASLVVDDGFHSEALGQAEYSNGNAQRRRPGTRKRKRRPQLSSVDASVAPTAESPSKYWRGLAEDDKDTLSSGKLAVQLAEEEIKPPLQTSFKRRKQSAIREPLAALEKEQKLYELRNKPDISSEIHQGSNLPNRNSENLKNILKNNGGLSLSEILQQKNLSLDDLLKGKQNALQALQTTATAPVQRPQGMKYPTKPKFKPNTPTVKLTDSSSEEEMENSRERNKLTALHRLKLFGSSSRPSGIQVGLVDHLTTRKKEGTLTTTSTTTTTVAPSTTRIPLYRKILHQRPTLKSSFLLKNTVMTSAEPDRIITSWDGKEIENTNKQEIETEEDAQEMQYEEKEEYRDESIHNSEDITTQLPESLETTTFKEETTISKEKPAPRGESFTTRRMYTTNRGLPRITNRFKTSTTTTTPLPTTTSSTTTTHLPMTTTTTTSTTTASSSTMNLTPKANQNLNTEDIRERIQETLLKNFIEKEDSAKNAPTSDETDNEDDLENFFEETPRPRTTKYLETSTITTRMKQFSTSPKPTESLIPDFDNVDDRTDLLELIEDRRSGNRLFKVLEQRNMTLEELIEHRKRGSSQLHLATIVNTPSRFYPDKKVVLQDNMDIVTAFENFPHFNLLNLKSVKPDDIKTDSQGSSYFTSIIDIEPTDEIYKTNKGLPATSSLSSNVDKAALLPDRSEKSLDFFPSWKTLALASLATTTTNNNNKDVPIKRNPFFLAQPNMLLDNNSDIEDEFDVRNNELSMMNNNDTTDEVEDYGAQNPIQAAVRLPDQTAEAIENEVARAHDLVDLELSGHGFKRSPQAPGALAHSHKRGSFYTNMPAGIKSAIVASATIVLTALVTFMVIFGVCRWKQKRHRMTNIMKSYNAMKSKLPTISTTTQATTTNPNSRRSSCRDMNNLLSGSGLSVAATITTTSSSTAGMPITPPPVTSLSQATTMLAGKKHNSCGQHNKHQLERQSSLLFQRSMNTTTNNEKPTNLAILSGCNLLDIKRNNNMRGSTTSLSFSLTSGHNISNSHINTVDATSPEVQEYLFDTLRNSF